MYNGWIIKIDTTGGDWVIEFHFKQLNGQIAISVIGNYDWEIVGETLIRIFA